MKFVLGLALLAIVANYGLANPLDQEITSWQQFKQTFNKKYNSPAEESIRKANFESSFKFIQENGHKFQHQLGINENSDLAAEELVMDSASMQQYIDQMPRRVSPVANFDEYDALPAHFDYRQLIQVNPIENQGACGSCWAYGVTATLEIGIAYKEKKPGLKLSKQELVDCARESHNASWNNQGCQLGYAFATYRYIESQGLHEEHLYPYNGKDDEQCYTFRLEAQHEQKYFIKSHVCLERHAKDEDMMAAIVQHGPIAVSVWATNPEFRDYKGGIIRKYLMDNFGVNHQIALVGYGTENGTDYWIGRNSWGPSWGKQGYVRIERHDNNGAINNYVCYPVL